MQTFLPYSDFTKSATCLDYKRLGKQRVEAWQIYNTLRMKKIKESGKYCKGCSFKCQATECDCLCHGHAKIAWENHPAVKMWIGYESLLLRYILRMIEEWKRRGFKDNMYEKVFQAMQLEDLNYPPNTLVPTPSWINYEPFHKSHRAKLHWKSPGDYPQFMRDWQDLTTGLMGDEPDYLWYIDNQWKIINKKSNNGGKNL